MAGGELSLQLVVGYYAAFFEIDQQHPAGLQTPLAHDVLFLDRQDASFGGHDDNAVFGDKVTSRAQAVTVKRCADLTAVGKGHRGRAVPRLHQAGVIFVKRAAFAIHARIAGPSFRDQHHSGVAQRIAAHGQEFERVVEARRV